LQCLANRVLWIAAQRLAVPGTKAYQSSKVFRTYVQDLIDKVQQQTIHGNTKGQHYLIHAMAMLAQKQEWSREVLENEVMTLIFAGHDTTANHTWFPFLHFELLPATILTLSFGPCKSPRTTIALENCIQHPSIIDEMRKEYHQCLLESKQDDCSNVMELKELNAKMKWPTAAFKESLRLNPETPGGTIRVAPNDTPLGEYVIPKGCSVLCPMWIYSHSEKNWGPDAKEFNPKRFLPTDSVSATTTANNTYRNYVSFSQGKRNCVGMPLAYMEGSMLLGYILTHLDITVESPLKKVFSVTLRAKDFIIGVKRNHQTKY
jgi:cytochrome P450